jgi:hypothetical protein
MGTIYFHAGGITSPLQVILSLATNDEEIDKIPAFCRDFLITVFAEFADPVIGSCLANIPKTRSLGKQLLQRVGKEITGSRNNDVSKGDFCRISPYQVAVAGAALVLQVEINHLGDEKIVDLKSSFQQFQSSIFKGSGLMWLQVDTVKLTDHSVKKKFEQFVRGKQDSVNIRIVNLNKKICSEAEIKRMLEIVLGIPADKFVLKRRKKITGLCYHLWIDPKVLQTLGLSDFGLTANSGYKPLEEIFAIVEKAVAEKKRATDSILEASTSISSEEEMGVPDKVTSW